jgi:hypothetical protein
VVGGNQSGKGAKGLLMGKGAAAAAAAAAAVDDKKDKKKPTSRSSRAGLQVCSFPTDLNIIISYCLLRSILLFGAQKLQLRSILSLSCPLSSS